MYRDSARVSLSPSDFMALALEQGEKLGFSRPSLLQAVMTLREVASRSSRDWEVWQTLKIGGKRSSELVALLKEKGFYVSDWVRDIMGKPAFTTLAEPKEIQLVCIKVKDLGFTSEPTTKELFARASELGLDLCPGETGPHLRLALTDQPFSDQFWVAMEPISDSSDSPHVFCVGRSGDGKQWLVTGYVHPDVRWGLGNEVVFSLRPD